LKNDLVLFGVLDVVKRCLLIAQLLF